MLVPDRIVPNLSDPQTLNRYSYANNNPVKYTDPSGYAAETAWDAFNVITGAVSLGKNLAAGNYLGAVVDGVGVLLDSAAMVIPFVPGGASTAIKTLRAADKGVDALRTMDKAADGARAAKKAAHAGDAAGAAYKAGTALDTVTDVAKNGRPDFIVSPKGTTMPTNKDFNLVDSNKKGGDWFQIHNKHTDAKVAGSPHTHYPKQHGGSRTREIKRTDGRDLDYADSSLRDGTMRQRINRSDKGGMQ